MACVIVLVMGIAGYCCLVGPSVLSALKQLAFGRRLRCVGLTTCGRQPSSFKVCSRVGLTSHRDPPRALPRARFPTCPVPQTFNSSPDEAAYARMIFNREDVSNSLVMMQPSLICYSFQNNGQPQAVLLDATSVRPDVILLLDTFFHVLIFHGETIASWREQGYQNLPEHGAFKQLLQAPRDDAAAIQEARFPVPRYIVCDQHKSQARFLMARLNPSVTHNTMDGTGTAPIFTDDVSFHVFMEHLMKLAVQS